MSAAQKSIPVAILVRVSSQKQQTDRQISDLTAFASSNGYQVVEICEETVSGRVSADQRTGLQRVEELARQGKIKKVLVHEISRIGRRNSVTHKFVENLLEMGVSLYWHQQRIETLLPCGKRNPAAGIMLALLSEMALAETETLRERILSGLTEAKKKGVKLGRPAGTTISTSEFLKKHKEIVRLLANHHSIRNAAKISGKGISTVQKVKAQLSGLMSEAASV
jgi:DNA invertase Pin-like site-specific DNA recombinase